MVPPNRIFLRNIPEAEMKPKGKYGERSRLQIRIYMYSVIRDSSSIFSMLGVKFWL